ncbi:MAG TPA: gamma-glutamylcyclotransferase [Comamonadaceae bacterium]|nr:gamma-glutamylcyclotransferase [Comamonadaceae bacterium]
MTPRAFTHLPELAGRLTPTDTSGLRLTDEVLAAWDAQAREQGQPPDWRLPDEEVERSRQAVLAGRDGEDLWVFGYGSLMWNPGIHFREVRRARLDGFARRFALATTIGRGTPECPGLVLTLQRQAGVCHGLVFRIHHALVETESRLLWRREMIRGGYCPALLPLETPQGGVEALVLTANTAHPQYRHDLSLQDTAAIIASACGSIGSNRDYLDQLNEQLDLLGIEDGHVRELSDMVQSEVAKARHENRDRPTMANVYAP